MAQTGLALQSEAHTDIPTAGTRVQVDANLTHVHVLRIEAPTTNAGVIYVGDSGVSSTNFIAVLNPGEGVNLSAERHGINPSTVYVDAATNGDDFAWGYL